MLRFEWDWESAPDVRSPELRATWSTLQIDIGDVTATLVEERGSRSGLRRRINVPTYPLAEWIAYRWWAIVSPTPRGGEGFRLADAGDGFPWPDLRLSSGPGYVLARLRPADREHEAVRFLTSAELLLSPHVTERELRRFVEDTVQQLEDAGVTKTSLQEEWAAIAAADDEVVSFCQTAAALGLDPFDLTDDETQLVLGLGSGIPDPALAADLAAAIERDDVELGREWLQAALGVVVSSGQPPALALPFQKLPIGSWEPPWRVGYERARRLRQVLALEPTRSVDIEELVDVNAVDHEAPRGVTGLAEERRGGTVVAVPSGLAPRARRFAAARAVGRRTFDDSRGGLLLTSRDDYAAKVERAFAAELLAPAAGLAQVMAGSASDSAIVNAAEKFGVPIRVVEHQLENQLGWDSF